MRLQEIIENNDQFERLWGARFSLMVGFEIFSYELDSEELKPVVDISLVGGWPISRRWQLSNSFENTLSLPPYRSIVGYRPDLYGNANVNLWYHIGESLRLATDIAGDYQSFLSYYTGDYDVSTSVSFTPMQLVWYIDDSYDLRISPSYQYKIIEEYYHVTRKHNFEVNAYCTWRLR